ncbi:MAG TPA: hypothetical protein DEQ02_01560 [Ruminococcaceae bacterium]|nr:hypothetical protein [Oscillospiraceae bacterium]
MQIYFYAAFYTIRDGRTEQEREDLICRISDTDNNVFVYVTPYNDIETLFCLKDHVQTVLQNFNITDEQYQTTLDYCLQEIKDESIKKIITNRCKYRHIHNNQGAVALDTISDYESDPLHYVYGKKLRGLLAGKLQEICGINVNLFVSTEYLSDPNIGDYV